MRPSGKTLFSAIVLFAMAVALPMCYHLFIGSPRSLDAIRDRGVLTMLTSNNANCYYIYKDTPMGFEYELARAFARSLGVDLEVKTPGWNNLIPYVQAGRGDFIAAGMTDTREREALVDFSHGYMRVQQQVIVHKNNYRIDTTDDLNGTTIHVRKGTTYQQRLEELNAAGMNITIELHENVPTEEFIEMVSNKTIEITIADSNIALLNRRYYPDIRIAFPVEEEQQLAWAVADGDRALRAAINDFFETIKQTGQFAKIYDRYYSRVEFFDYFDLKKFHERIETRLPRYKPIIQSAAAKYGFDWEMIAAVIYQESHFNPYAKSYTGVRGLMQLTQTTAQEMGVSNRLDPAQSVRGGVRYLAKMARRFDDINDPRTRLLFALASYNIGYGHVRDAQKIAAQKGLDPTRWRDLKEALPLLRNRQYYKKTRYGYARGTEPVRYVEQILMYYDILKQKSMAGCFCMRCDVTQTRIGLSADDRINFPEPVHRQRVDTSPGMPSEWT
ncbi:MAG: membrane-bound lytic murein transglycosylase MltF [Thermodesulfobacteriota bacterium]|nr:membrane-bound lytic murein transglycosylase MltF [Thermodesulfobacteriota bacterium]